MVINNILISRSCIKKLEKYGLISNYQKAKGLILSGELSPVDFKKKKTI